MANHGTATKYRDGCRCPKCKASNTARTRARRNRIPDSDHRVVPLPKPKAVRAVPNTPNTVGRIESAFVEQYAPVAHQKPALFEVGRTVAADLENPDLIGSKPQLLRQYQAICAQLDATPKKSRGRLAAVQQMTKPERRQA